MLTATEQQVKMAAQLYEMRDKARWLLGDKYKPHMAKFLQLVPFAVDQNKLSCQSKFDFSVMGHLVDVKSSIPKQLNARYPAKSWAFSFKKQSLTCDFICCFCLDEQKEIEHVLLVPREFFVGLQTISVSQYGSSKWLDYSVKQDELSSFFISLGNKQ